MLYYSGSRASAFFACLRTHARLSSHLLSNAARRGTPSLPNAFTTWPSIFRLARLQC